MRNASTEPPEHLYMLVSSLMDSIDRNAVTQNSSPSGIAAHLMARGIVLALTNQQAAMQVLEILHHMMINYISVPDQNMAELETIVPLILASDGLEKYRGQ